jgi:hypothetical protein
MTHDLQNVSTARSAVGRSNSRLLWSGFVRSLSTMRAPIVGDEVVGAGPVVR